MNENENQGGLTPSDQTPPSQIPPGFKAVATPSVEAAVSAAAGEVIPPVVDAPAPVSTPDVPALDEIDLNPPAEEVPPAAEVDVQQPAQTQAEQDAKADNSASAPWEGLGDIPKQANVKQTFETYYPEIVLGKNSLAAEMLILPADTADRVDQWSERHPDENLTTENDRNWAAGVQAGELTRYHDEQFVAAVDREGSDWQQQLQHENIPLIAARPRLAQAGENMLTGARAVQRVRALMGMGTIVQVPLWESGFWMTFRAPEEGDLLDLFNRLVGDKVSLGRRTYGLAFANSRSFIARGMLDFAMNHLHDLTLKGELDPRKFIKVHDLETIAWAMAMTIWPKGFNYSRSVLGGEGTEKVIKKGRLDLSKMQFVDKSRLSAKQIAHMSKRMGSTMTQDMIDSYQAEFKTAERRVELAPNMFMTLHVPNVDSYLLSGTRWVDSISSMVDKAFAEPPDDESRDRYVTQKGKATIMRQFGHWVKNLIEIDGDREIVFSDPDTIDELLNTLSADDEVRKKYFDAIRTYTDDTTTSVIATPTVNKVEENLLPRFPRLVPIDAQYTFFTLLVQKINRIQVRPDL